MFETPDYQTDYENIRFTRMNHKTVILWDVRTGKKLQAFDGHSGIVAVAFSPDGLMAVTVFRDGIMAYWDVQTGKRFWAETVLEPSSYPRQTTSARRYSRRPKTQ